MSGMKFDHIELAETSRHRPSLQEEDIIPQRFRGNFISQQLDSITACNQNDNFLGPFQYGGTASLSTGNLTGRKNPQGETLLVLAYGVGRNLGDKATHILEYTPST